MGWGVSEMLKTCIPDSSELVFMSYRNASLISVIANAYPQAHHRHCVRHLSQNVKCHASNVNRDVVAWRFMELSRHYTEVEFKKGYESFMVRYPAAGKYVEEATKKHHWARYCFPGERYNIDTSNPAESLNYVFDKARSYSLIPLLYTVIKKLSSWFNKHRKKIVARSINHKMVPLVENAMHDWWPIAEKLKVTELNQYQLEYDVTDVDGKTYLVNLLQLSCSCRFFYIERYPCLHALAAFIKFNKQPDRIREIQLHELCSRYYWTESWKMAYYRTIYLVTAMTQWNVPDDIKEMQIKPLDRKKKIEKVSLLWRKREKDTKQKTPKTSTAMDVIWKW